MATIDIPLLNDTYFADGAPTTNYDTSTVLAIGQSTNVNRAWIKPDFSTVPKRVKFLSATFYITPIVNVGTTYARTMYAQRCLKSVVSNQATWNVYSTGNNWSSGGASGAGTDYDNSVSIGTMSVPASCTLNVAMAMTLNAAELQKLYDGTYGNNGIVLFVNGQLADQKNYASTNHATVSYRPHITIEYVRLGGFWALA